MFSILTLCTINYTNLTAMKYHNIQKLHIINRFKYKQNNLPRIRRVVLNDS